MGLLGISEVKAQERPLGFRVARFLVWVFEKMIYPLGGRGYSSLTGILLGHSVRARVIFKNGGGFTFPCSDGYYASYILANKAYEPEIALICEAIYSNGNPPFIDCGANFGYWSSAVSAMPMMEKRVVAIEPSQFALPILEENQIKSEFRFAIERAAIWESEGANLNFEAMVSHAASKISDKAGQYAVKGTTIDSVTRTNGWDRIPVVVKLDVEGAEIQAFRGAENTANQGSIFIYEDHGSDLTSKVTEHLLLNSWKVFYILESGLISIFKASDLARFKEDRSKGYNLIAWKSESSLTHIISEQFRVL